MFQRGWWWWWWWSLSEALGDCSGQLSPRFSCDTACFRYVGRRMELHEFQLVVRDTKQLISYHIKDVWICITCMNIWWSSRHLTTNSGKQFPMLWESIRRWYTGGIAWTCARRPFGGLGTCWRNCPTKQLPNCKQVWFGSESLNWLWFKKTNYFTSSDPHHDMLGEGLLSESCQHASAHFFLHFCMILARPVFYSV